MPLTQARELNLRARMQALIEESDLPVCITEDDHIVHANRAAVQVAQAGDAQALRGRLAWQVLYPTQVERARALLAPRAAPLGSAAAADSAAPAACATLASSATAATAATSAAFAAPTDQARHPEDGCASPLPFVMQAVSAEFKQRRRLVDELDRSRRVLREMSARIEQAREEERRIIARQLHDDLGQQLSMIKVHLATLAQDGQPAETRRVAREVSALLAHSVDMVRNIVSELRPLMLDDLGLNAAVEWLAHQVSRQRGMGVTVRLSDAEPPVSDESATVLFRLTQEALANAVRHACATKVEVSLTCRDDAVCLTVLDNGIGLPADALERPGTLGLKAMRERVAMLGGQFMLDNPPGQGARVRVQLPLDRAMADLPGPVPPRIPYPDPR